MNNAAVIKHYDLLISENNDPLRDPKILRDYMDKWDGQSFIDKMELTKAKAALEIGVGTGRLAARTAPLCGRLCGIDISPKTVERAKENLKEFKNITLICDDFLKHKFNLSFDVVYSSLTFMHIEQKQKAVSKIAALLNTNGKFILSTDKNQSPFIDTATSKIAVFPDTPEEITDCIARAGLKLTEHFQTEFAHIFVSVKE